jgi:hypothetical protein
MTLTQAARRPELNTYRFSELGFLHPAQMSLLLASGVRNGPLVHVRPVLTYCNRMRWPKVGEAIE